MNRTPAALTLALAMLALPGCAEDDPTAPPEIAYGASVCDYCDMIISDERFATATIVLDERHRPAPLLFDDFNCQADGEADLDESAILARWVHDHATRAWIRTGDAHFVRADGLRTPMASHVAAFTDADAARAAADEWGGETLTFDALRARLGGAPMNHQSPSDQEDAQP